MFLIKQTLFVQFHRTFQYMVEKLISEDSLRPKQAGRKNGGKSLFFVVRAVVW